MSTFSDGVYQFGGMPVGGKYYSKVWWVFPSSGSDSNKGTRPQQPLKTLSKAQTLATADNNEAVFLVSESNSASSTTDYQSAALDWAKDGVDLIGVCAGNHLQQRARIAQLSTATGVSNLFTVSADNCFIANISIFHGVDDATSLGAVLVSGQRNKFYNVSMSGIGHATQDAANNYSLKVTGSENLFEECYIGLSTIARATATYEMAFDSGATRNTFRKCMIDSYGNAAFAHVYVPSNGIDRWNMFDDCVFMNMPTGDASGTTMDEVFDVTGGGSPDGIIVCHNCSFFGVTDVEKDTVSGKVMVSMAAANAQGGKATDAS